MSSNTCIPLTIGLRYRIPASYSVMTSSMERIYPRDSSSGLYEEDLAYLRPRQRQRIAIGDSDSGCSEVSVVSDWEAGNSTSPALVTAIKRRAVSPPLHDRTKASRRGSIESKSEPVCEPQLSSQCGQDFSLPLAKSFPQKQGGLEVVILRQPEAHHRARYQKEGSRGCIKDKSGNTCPAVQLKGVTMPSVLQIFVATETGRIRPHPLYRACRVGGKHCTPARVHAVAGITVLELEILPENNGIINIDCLGILKLRSADLEMLSEEGTGKRRQKAEPKVRLVFRAITKSARGTVVILQIGSTSICCAPSPGMPEIHRISHPQCTATGGLEIVIIGRNFLQNDSKFFVVERDDDGDTLWEREISLLPGHFQHVHVVGAIPPYKDLLITQSVEVFLVVKNKNKQKVSEPYPFKYTQVESVSRLLQRHPPASPTQQEGNCRSVIKSPFPSQPNPSHPTPCKDPQRSQFSQVCPLPFSYQQNNSMAGSKRLSPPQRPPLFIEATLVEQARIYTANHVQQYCIQPPGGIQPIYISFPQSVNMAMLVEPTTSGRGGPGLAGRYDNSPLGFSATELGSGIQEMTQYDMRSEGDWMVNADDGAFWDGFLRDIMGPW